jgi:hypothetical protein
MDVVCLDEVSDPKLLAGKNRNLAFFTQIASTQQPTSRAS